MKTVATIVLKVNSQEYRYLAYIAMPATDKKREYQSLVSPKVRMGGLSNDIHRPRMKMKKTAEPILDAVTAFHTFLWKANIAPIVQQRVAIEA